MQDSRFLLIVIHNKDQFSPYADSLAGSKSLMFIPEKSHENGTEIRKMYEVSKRKIELISTKTQPCNDTSDTVNFIQCFYDYIDSAVGCSAPTGIENRGKVEKHEKFSQNNFALGSFRPD